MSSLFTANLSEPLGNGSWVASSLEVGNAELGEGILVEGSFEVLQAAGTVKSARIPRQKGTQRPT